jgi:hypothetical protein
MQITFHGAGTVLTRSQFRFKLFRPKARKVNRFVPSGGFEGSFTRRYGSADVKKP